MECWVILCRNAAVTLSPSQSPERAAAVSTSGMEGRGLSGGSRWSSWTRAKVESNIACGRLSGKVYRTLYPLDILAQYISFFVIKYTLEEKQVNKEVLYNMAYD